MTVWGRCGSSAHVTYPVYPAFMGDHDNFEEEFKDVESEFWRCPFRRRIRGVLDQVSKGEVK
jgi:hypothetical protein